MKLTLLNKSVLTVVASLLMAGVCRAQGSGVNNFVGVPRFHLSGGQIITVGRAFAIKWFGEKKILLCPLHLLGPTGGLAAQIEAKDVGSQVSFLEVLDLKAQSVIARGGNALLKTGKPVERCTKDDRGQDLMAFALKPKSQLTLLNLAPALAPVGTQVWVLSKNIDATDNLADRYPGKISQSSAEQIIATLDEPLTAMSSSGAPVVNAKGELVAMMVGIGGRGRSKVVCVPSTAIAKRLTKEIGR